MSKGQWAFRPAVLSRAIKAAEKAGKSVVEVEIDSVTGKIELRFQKTLLRRPLPAICALRENQARTAIKNPVLGQDTGPVTNPHFLSNKNSELRAAKSGSSIPFNVLGGYRWPDATPIDRDLLRKIIRAEVGST